jgi:hypothetical protein
MACPAAGRRVVLGVLSARFVAMSKRASAPCFAWTV